MSRLDDIKARAAAIIPGPWAWMGNTATDQVYLSTNGRGRLTILQPSHYWTESIYVYATERVYTLQEAREQYEEICGAHDDDEMLDNAFEGVIYEGYEDDFMEYPDEWGEITFRTGRGCVAWLKFAFSRLKEQPDHCPRCEAVKEWLRGDLDSDGGDSALMFPLDYHSSAVRHRTVHEDLRFPEAPNASWTAEALERRNRHGGHMKSYREMCRYEVLGKLSRDDGHFHEYATRAENPTGNLYREDFCGIATPEAEFIQYAAEDIPFLLAEIDALRDDKADLTQRVLNLSAQLARKAGI